MPESVTVEELVKNVRLKVLQGEDYLQRPIVTSDICRPALEFAGYFTHYPAERIQLLGITETSFAKDMTQEHRTEYMTKMCMPQTPCFVISTDLP
ncbi:MAG: HPr kinase/phosphorylase, partial [Limosilactobacillus mucosae]